MKDLTKYPEITRDFIYQLANFSALKEKKYQDFYKKFGDNLYSLVIQKIAGIELAPEEAKKSWEGILRHKFYLRTQLKRDVKLEVAALDYFYSITNYIESPVILEEKIFNGLRETIMVDELTGLYNYRYFKKRIEEEFHYAKRYNKIFSIIVLDIDDFKDYNDKYGHLKGNDLLKEIGNIIVKRIRKSDIPIRYGGDEFVVILPDTNKRGAFTLADNLRLSVSQKKLDGNITLSGGVATFPTDTDKSGEELFELADKALYRAKVEGKNRVSCYPVERREFKRISLKGKKIKFNVISPENLKSKITELKDISLGGISFYIQQALPVLQYIELEIFTKIQSIKFKGYVVWCSQMDENLYEAGVKFVEISREDLKILKGLD